MALILHRRSPSKIESAWGSFLPSAGSQKVRAMPIEANLQAIAAEIIQAQNGHSRLGAISASGRELSMSEAYKVSWLVHEERLKSGWKPVGRKIGFTNRDMWSLLGVAQPIWSFVYDRTCEEIGSPHRCPLRDLVQPKIEPEIVFCMRASPSPGAGEEEVLDCVEWMAHGIEMVQCHYPDWKFTSTDAICDSSFHGKLLVGKKRSVSRDRSAVSAMLKTCEVALYRGDELVESGQGRNVLGSPLLAVTSLIEALHQEGAVYPILAGEVITTGTMTKAYPVNAGERWRTAFEQDEFPGLTIDFV
jgi:2-keto-4-pentenoate hydratase